jgi:hypothetical protein
VHSDAWVRRLSWTALGAVSVAVILFLIFKFVLVSGASDLATLGAQLVF